MSNSTLVDYTRLTHNCSKPRSGKICRITIHHMAGNLTVEQCASVFSGTRQASSNYGIGTDGRVGLYVEECNRAWTSSSKANDNLAVTIEVANSKAEEPWPVSDAAYEKLILLCTDICRRNGKTKLLYLGDKATTLAYQPADDEMVLTMHQWFAATNCPGAYLKARFGEIAERVTEKLEGDDCVSYEDWKAYMKRYMAEAEESEPSKWAAESCEKAVNAGIAKGDGQGAYNWQKPLTREAYFVFQDRQGALDGKA